MANVNRPQGFLPLRHLNGSAYNGKAISCVIPAADGTATFIGDVVVTDGAAAPAGTVIAGMNCEGLLEVVRSSAGTTVQTTVGVVVGFLVDPTNLALRYRLASTARVALVAPAADTIFEIQEDAVTTPIPAASIGLNASYSLTAGSTVTGMSGMEIISANVATTATFPLKLLGLVKRIDNAFNTAGTATDQAKFEVMFNGGVWAPNVAGN